MIVCLDGVELVLKDRRAVLGAALRQTRCAELRNDLDGRTFIHEAANNVGGESKGHPNRVDWLVYTMIAETFLILDHSRIAETEVNVVIAVIIRFRRR